ncbi:hypothetical protein B0T16DRAFT_5914 [Cercophora newfieldiana]|uniref:Cellobiose dehydrogenase-like cytochrome domain-containing protein n=1 Tax=Cercophora newfieldiana TaxID=92897 RepID=A0AA39YNK2_9PEZI|nr:hypothetical protein B0T16DRAFT_5914 [Cercophora newfieldiana]
MVWNIWIGVVTLMLTHVATAAASVFRDPETGLTFASEFTNYRINQGITYRIAQPSDAVRGSPFDIIVQIVAPIDVGWTGLAFGGTMRECPLLLVWRNSAGNGVVVSSRWARGHVTPESYNGISFTLYKTGTKVNGTHFQATLKCTGCSYWTNNSGGTRFLLPGVDNRIAMAYSPTRPSNANSNTSSIAVHDVHAYWSHQLGQGVNANFGQVMQTLS